MAFDAFRDARTIESGAVLNADVCIAGAGAAGITLARALIASGVRVCLLEAGGLSVEPDVNALSVIENAGRPYRPNELRLRYFGGTTNHWGGHCVPLLPMVFSGRDWIEHSAWPYAYGELLPYYEAAHQVLRIGPFDYSAQRAAADLGVQLLPIDGAFQTVMSRYNRMRFGLTYGEELNDSPRLQCVLHADLSGIDLASAESDTVRSVRVRSSAGNEFTVRARFFVIACGGIENARILLNANHQRPAGLGNHADMAGRYFMEHVWYESGYILPRAPLSEYEPYVREVAYGDIATRFHLALTPEAERELEVGAFRAELLPRPAAYREAYFLRYAGPGAADVSTLLSRPFELGHALRCGENATPDAFVLGNYVEQRPNPESRVTLSETRDALGRPNARLDWRLMRADHDGVVRAHRVLAREVGAFNVGRMHIAIKDEYEIELHTAGGGAHHMGTTRMHDDPSQGVTDAHGRVHHTENLYMAGSSLFPSAGYANPTLTIVALSLKLADKLKRRLRGEPR
jgi:choline dehydrogenase-like flavoprotein